MKKILEKLWDDYLYEECSMITTDEERNLTKKAAELHAAANRLLNKEQKEAVEQFVYALCKAESLFVKKAFFKGFEFAALIRSETEDDKE